MNLGAILDTLAPELVLLFGGCAVLVIGLFGSPEKGRCVAVASLATVGLAFLASLSSEAVASEILPGLWVTSLTLYVRWITLGMGVLFVLVNWRQPVESERGEYMAMILFSLLGVLLTAMANDLLVLFFAIELVGVPTYILIALSRTDTRASEAAVKYFFLGALSAALLAYGLSFLYGQAGTTSMFTFAGSTPHAALSASSTSPMLIIGFALVFGGLAFKMAAVPFHSYAADVYEGAASPVTGLLGFVPKLAGFVALCKVAATLDWQFPAAVAWMIWIVAAATMTVGNVLALLQKNVKRLLAYSSIAHTGYMLIGFLVGPVAGQGPLHDGIAALLFYITVYGVMNLGTFAALAAFQAREMELETLADLGGLAHRAPIPTLAASVCVVSLIGLPPTAGFLGKVFIFSGAFSTTSAHFMHGALIALAIIGVVNAAIGAAYYLRIVAAAYMDHEVEAAQPVGGAPIRWGLALCSLSLLILFIWPGGLVEETRKATIVFHQTTQVDSSRVTAIDSSSHRGVLPFTQGQASHGHNTDP